MENGDNIKTLISLIKSQLVGQKEKTVITEDMHESLYKTAKAHDVTNVIGEALIKGGYIDRESAYYKLWQKSVMLAVSRHERLDYDANRVYGLLEKEKIYYIPLKGAVLKEYYPSPFLRTSCDIDVLVKKADFDRAVKLLVENGFSAGKKAEHDILMVSESGSSIEIHFRLLERDRKTEKLLDSVWEGKNNGYRISMSDGDFLLYYVAHTEKHFLFGGCGIRSVMDMWITENKMGISVKDNKDKLEKAGLYKFASGLSDLSKVWFGGAQYSEELKYMEEYIVKGEIYGTLEQLVKMTETQKKGKFGYIMARLFPSFQIMKGKFAYPILNKAPYLYPFCIVLRWIKFIFGNGRKKVKKEMQLSKNYSAEERRKTREMCEYLGILDK